jgi:replicative DNA helicase
VKERFDFGADFQLDLLKMTLESLSFLLLCKKYVKKEFFSNERFQFFYEAISKYHDKYGICPDKTYLKSVRRDRADRVFVKRLLRRRIIQEAFIREKVQEFVQRSMFVDTYERTGRIYNQQKPEQAYGLMADGMKEIFQVSMNEDQFEFLLRDFSRRSIERIHKLNSLDSFKVSTGIHTLDRVLGGGVACGEVMFWMGDAKSGKSFALVHNGVHAVRRFIPTLHIQLEGGRQQLRDRYDACFMGALYDDVRSSEIPDELQERMLKIAKRRKFKDLVMKHYEDYDSCDILDIERDLLMLRSAGFEIKLVIIDYFDLLRPRKGIRYEEERHKTTQIVRDLKTFAGKNKVAVITATQTNRYIESEDPNFIITSKNVSEDYNKIRALDILVTINATPEEMKSGTCRLYVDTVRDNPAHRLFRIRRDLSRSRFYVKKTT